MWRVFVKKQAIVIHELDNVATCVDFFTAGTTINFFLGGQEQTIELLEDIPLGHKVAIQPILQGTNVIKYAETIGVSLVDIAPGQHVHVHNMEAKRGRGDLQSKGVE
jgi:altronate dehydratase small subunit